jgi:hypothetical protein
VSFTPPPDVSETPRCSETEGDESARGSIRGSSLLLLGRLMSLGVMAAVQVLLVRHCRGPITRLDVTRSRGGTAPKRGALGLDRSVTLFPCDLSRAKRPRARPRSGAAPRRLRGCVGTLATLTLVSFPETYRAHHSVSTRMSSPS